MEFASNLVDYENNSSLKGLLLYEIPKGWHGLLQLCHPFGIVVQISFPLSNQFLQFLFPNDLHT